MKNAKLFTVLIVAFFILLCQGSTTHAESMGTAFTYQGRLIDDEAVADGLYDFQFKLFDSVEGGNQLNSDVNIPDMDVIDGYFTVELDFGGGVFNGEARWLDIGIRQGELEDPNVYTAMSPRQKVTAVPYALHTRGIFVDDAGNVSIGTNTPDPEDKLYVVVTGSDNMGVLAEATHPTGETTGIEGVVYSPNGIAGSFVNESGGFVLVCHSGTDPRVHAFSVDGNGDIWVEGRVFAKGSGSNFYGNVDVTGNLTVVGNLTKGSGSFKIDHPLDPENKYLSHSFVESPDMMNVYNGNVFLDENGSALIKLPEYFEALNRDFRYQLTCIGGFAPVYIAEKISGNRFKIGGGKAGMEVSWQVTGIRQDAYAKVNRIVVEENKSAEERGYYLHPAAYGLPDEQGIQAKNRLKFAEVSETAGKAGVL